MTFAEAVKIYSTSARATATREVVDAPNVRLLAIGVNQLRSKLYHFDSGGDDLWTSVVRRFSRILRELTFTPLSPSSSGFDLAGSVNYLSLLATAARGNYQDELTSLLDACIDALARLSHDSSNFLGDLIVDILSTADPSASGLLLKTPHFDSVAKWVLTRSPRLRVMAEGEVPYCYDMENLIVAGPSYRFPSHLLSAPRAETTCFVHYNFIRDRVNDTRLFAGSRQWPTLAIRLANTSAASGGAEIEEEFLFPVIDWDAVAKASRAQGLPQGDDIEIVPANLLLLTGGYSVYLEASDGPRIDVVADLEFGKQPKLHRIKTTSVQPGDYIVVRSEGGSGDYIESIADSLLGTRAAPLRRLHDRWKRALRTSVRATGISIAEDELRILGIPSPNIRYRMLRSTLRSQKYEDFRILMEYINLGDEANAIWNAMKDLSSAHIRAGHRVRKLLEKALVGSDPHQLMSAGRADIRLKEMDAGALSIFRVAGRSPEIVSINEDELHVIRRMKPDLWQE